MNKTALYEGWKSKEKYDHDDPMEIDMVGKFKNNNTDNNTKYNNIKIKIIIIIINLKVITIAIINITIIIIIIINIIITKDVTVFIIIKITATIQGNNVTYAINMATLQKNVGLIQETKIADIKIFLM